MCWPSSPICQDPLYILKRELRWIPFFGWYVMKMRLIPVHRGSRSKALKDVIQATKAEMARNPRQLIIYPKARGVRPERNRNINGASSSSTRISALPVVPVAHQAGLFWPRRKFLRYPGTIRARFLKPIEAGLDKEEFMRRLTERN